MSDLRQPTNVIEHRIEGLYQAYPHVQLGVTGLIGRQIVTARVLRWNAGSNAGNSTPSSASNYAATEG